MGWRQADETGAGDSTRSRSNGLKGCGERPNKAMQADEASAKAIPDAGTASQPIRGVRRTLRDREMAPCDGGVR